MAKNAPTPDGYALVFNSLSASLQASDYMGLYTLTSYDTLTCASNCDQVSGCSAFNVYLERDPTMNVNAELCPNPPSTTNYKCTLWGAPVSSEEATNAGQGQELFQIVIAGSNGWSSPHSTSIHPSKVYEQVTTKTPHHLPSAPTMVPRNSAERSMLHPAPAATWATNSSPSAKVKATTHSRARMLAILKRLMIASTQLMTAALCHAFVFKALVIQLVLVLIFSRYSSMPTFYLRTLSHKVSTAPCTMRPGILRTAQITASTATLTVIPCRNPTATPRARR